MIGRRRALGAAGMGLLIAPVAQSRIPAPEGLRPEFVGTYLGTVKFDRSIPLEDVFPPPKNPPAAPEDPTPIGIRFTIGSMNGSVSVWLRADGGPMMTSEHGETLRFGVPTDGVALLASSDAVPAPRSATLTLRPDSVGTEALFGHADGSFWRRHFTVRFLPGRINLILWIFDAAGTRARVWRGTGLRKD